MVDSVKSSMRVVDSQKSRPSGIDSAKGARSNTQVSASQESDTVELKSTEIASNLKELTSAPPVDFNKVSQIKNAIQQGKYPIDIDLVSEALMQAYRDMKR